MSGGGTGASSERLPLVRPEGGGQLPLFFAGAAVVALFAAAVRVLPLEPLALALWAVAAALLLRHHPAWLLATFCVLLPLQNLILAAPGTGLRYVDEGTLLCLAGLVFVPALIRRPAELLRDPFVQVALLFAALGLLAARQNQVPPVVALAGLFVTLDYFVLFLLLRALPVGRTELRAVLVSLTAVGLLALLAAVLQKAGAEEFALPWQLLMREHGVLRVPGLFEHPNDLGAFMLLLAVLGLAWLLANGGRMVAWLLAAMGVAGIVVAVSRATMVALLAAVLAGLWCAGPRVRRLLPWIAGALLVAGALAAPGFQARIAKVRAEGGDARIEYFKRSVPVFLAHPLLGVGPGRYGGEVAQRWRSPVYERYGVTFTGTWRTIDSFWAHLAVEAGLAGGGAFLLLLFLAWRRARALLPAATDPWVRCFLLAVPMLIGAALVLNLSSMSFEANSTGGMFWLLLGAGLSAGGDRLGWRPSSPTS